MMRSVGVSATARPKFGSWAVSGVAKIRAIAEIPRALGYGFSSEKRFFISRVLLGKAGGRHRVLKSFTVGVRNSLNA